MAYHPYKYRFERKTLPNAKLQFWSHWDSDWYTVKEDNIKVPVCTHMYQQTQEDVPSFTFDFYNMTGEEAWEEVEDSWYFGYRFLPEELFGICWDDGDYNVTYSGAEYVLKSPSAILYPNIDSVDFMSGDINLVRFYPDKHKDEYFLLSIIQYGGYKWPQWTVYKNGTKVFTAFERCAVDYNPQIPYPVTPGGVYRYDYDPAIFALPFPNIVNVDGVDKKMFVYPMPMAHASSGYIIMPGDPPNHQPDTTMYVDDQYSEISDDSLDDIIEIVNPPAPGAPNEFYFYNHSKKVNSTKQPAGGTKIEGYFREPFNLMNPVIHIEATNEFPYNYCKWHDSANNLDRYYWIQNKAWHPNEIVELALEEDTLATFKSAIGSTQAFIKRSASNFNPLITDESWVTKNGPDISHWTPIGSPFDLVEGFYVVGIVENDQGSANPCVFDRIGGVDYYACKEAELDDLINFLADLGATGHWGDYRPLDRIVCCRFFPFTLYADSTAVFQNAIWHHSYEDTSGQTVTTNFNWTLHKYTLSGIVSGSCSVTPQDHPQAGTDRLYLNYQPYTELELKAGPFGKIDLSRNMIPYDALSAELTLNITADLITGLTKLQVNSDTEILYFTEDYSATVDIALSQEYVNRYSDLQQRDFNKRSGYVQAAVQGVSGAGATITAAFTQNPMLLATGLALMASTAATADKTNKQYLMDTYNMSVPQVSCRGTNGGWMKISENWRLTATYHLVAGDGPALLGRPKQDTALISTCSGYVLCNATSFEDSRAILPEVTIINEFLNNGFYYE